MQLISCCSGPCGAGLLSWPCQFVRALLVMTSIFIFGSTNFCKAQALERWVYVSANFLLPSEVDRVEQLMKECRPLGYSHLLITDSKFCRLKEMDKRYFQNISRIAATAKQLDLKLVPAVFPVGYSNSLLSQDVNMAEGLPVRDALFEIHGKVANLVADPRVSLPSMTDRKQWNFVDKTLLEDGDFLRANEPQGDNCRIMKSVKVSPFRHYHVSIRVRTENFKGQPEITVLAPGSGRRLTHTNLNASRTQDWTTHHITFNSLDNSTVNVYAGAWSANGGSLWLADPQMEECGLMNVLRREGTPLRVSTSESEPRGLIEGIDFETVRDDQLGTVPYSGEYDIWHESPSIRMKGDWPDGTQLRVSWYHPHIIYDGQVCGCVTEPAFVDLLKKQAEGVEQLFPLTDRMMSHDEWRLMGWDESFQKLGKTPGEVAAENVRLCSQHLREQHQDRRVFVWSDMFDPHHNAVDNYYLVNGDLTGSWEGLEKDVAIVNWNFGLRAESLKFFSDRGHQQILAGYYDADAEQIGKWLDTVKKHKTPGVIGVMYTTWKQDYSHLKEFKEVVDRFETAPDDL